MKHTLLFAAVFISVVCAFQLMEITGAWDNIWQSGIFLAFPAVAVIAGWISLFISRKKVKLLLQEPIAYDTAFEHENIFQSGNTNSLSL